MEKIVRSKINLEIRRALKLLVQYFGVAFSSIPAGILCYLLISYGLTEKSALIIASILGLILAVLFWRTIEKRIQIAEFVPKSTLENNSPVFKRNVRYSLTFIALWFFKKNFQIFVRTHLTSILIFLIAILTVFRETFEYLHINPNLEIPNYIWFMFVILLSFIALVSAIWETFGNKIVVSQKERRLTVGFSELISIQEKFNEQLSQAIDVKSVEFILNAFINDVLRTSRFIIGGNYKVESSVLLHEPNQNMLVQTFESKGKVEICIRLDENPDVNKGPIIVAFESRMVVHMPSLSSQIGLLFSEHQGEYVFENFFNGKAELFENGQNKFKSLLVVPISKYVDEGRKADYGVLNFMTESKDIFLPLDYYLATSFATMIAQGINAFRLKKSKLMEESFEKDSKPKINIEEPQKPLIRDADTSNLTDEAKEDNVDFEKIANKAVNITLTFPIYPRKKKVRAE